MLKLARKNVAQATLTRKDMTELDFADNSFDGLAAFYSIIMSREKNIHICLKFVSERRNFKHFAA